MLQPRSTSLSDALRGASDLHGRFLSGVDQSVSFDALLNHTCLGPSRSALAGKNVLIASRGQFLTAVLLTELDGLAARLVLVPPDLKAEHLPSIVKAAAIDCIVQDEHEDEQAAPGVVTVLRCRWPLSLAAAPPPSGRVTEWLLLTSGTTGVPKLVQHSFTGLTAAIRPRGAPGRPLVWSTFYDIRRYGGLQIFLRAILGSGSLVLSDASEPVSATLHRLGRAGVTHLSGTPSHWRRALMSPAIAEIAPTYVRLSGEIADQTILDGLRQTFPQADIGHAYASTEAGVGFEVDDGLAGFPASFVGREGADVEMKVEQGSLRIRSARAASRYVGSVDLALKDPDGFVDTGDMVEEREGRFYFVGRRGGIINVGGLKVHPEEVEAIINGHPAVRMSLCQGRRNPITGAIVIASVVLTSPAPTSDEERLRREILGHCRSSLPPHKVPALLRFVDTLEVTPAGKLVRPNA